MVEEGRQIVCDVCGTKLFRTYSADFHEDGWEHINGIGDVCPECAKAYRNMVDAWMYEQQGGMYYDRTDKEVDTETVPQELHCGEEGEK